MTSTSAMPASLWKKTTAPSRPIEVKGLSTSSRDPQSTKMVHSVVQGVSKLNLCVASPPPQVDTECYFYEIGHDDGSHTTVTATSSRSGGLSVSSPQQSPKGICQGPRVRLPPLPLPPISSATRNHSGKVRHAPKYYSATLERWAQEQQRRRKPFPEQIREQLELKKRWEQQQQYHHHQQQHRQKPSQEQDWGQLELKKKWEQQRRQHHHQQRHQQQEDLSQEEEQPTKRISAVASSEEQMPCPEEDARPDNIEKKELDKDEEQEDDDNSRTSDTKHREDNGVCVDDYMIDDEQDLPSQIEGCPDDKQQENDYDDQEVNYEDPPLTAQTSYARQQLLRSSRYRELQRQASARKQAQDDDDGEAYFCYPNDALFLDEVDISRGLGGYEEGFSVPRMDAHLYHHLPLSITEEDDEASLSSSVCDTSSTAGKGSSVGNTEQETITAAGGTCPTANIIIKDNDKEDMTSMCSSSRQASACVHCRNGTCDNEDCSNSRFMI